VARIDDGHALPVKMRSKRRCRSVLPGGPDGAWTLDWVALGSESAEEPIVRTLTPRRAVGPADRDLRATLAADDDAYFTALTGDRVELVFEAPPEPAAGWSRSVMAHTSGYYHIYVDQSGPARPDLVDRILDEPLFGNRYMLSQLLSTQMDAPN